MDKLLELILSPSGLVTAVGLVLTGLSFLLGSSEVRRRRVALATYHAFHIVEDMDTERADAKLDKAVEGLKAADDWMKAHGWRPLKPGEQEVAKLGFQALHGEDKVELARATAALTAAAVPSPR
jgi:hypothetical protein